jgi:pyridoxine 5'-phosphate synthase PdxJ
MFFRNENRLSPPFAAERGRNCGQSLHRSGSQQIKLASKLGVFQIEICTAQYAVLNEHPGDGTVRRTAEIDREAQRIRKCLHDPQSIPD